MIKPLATAKTVRDPHATGCVGHDHEQEATSDAHREGFGAGVEWADRDRDAAIAAAEARGYERAVANLRDYRGRRQWLADHNCWDNEHMALKFADYLEATKETDR